MEQTSNEEMLQQLQKDTFEYFRHEINPENGLIADCTSEGTVASIAAVGLALSAYPVAVERGFMTRASAVEKVLTTLRFFWNSPHGPTPEAVGHKGFYYHFLDMESGQRAWGSELSTVDTALLLAGILTAGIYFDGDAAEEREIRNLADALYRRTDWQWAQNGGLTVTHGWTPEEGFLGYRWKGYNEGILLYLLALGSPTHPLPPESYREWASTYVWKNIYGYEYLYAGPLFIHQLPHIWVDFRQIQDEYMGEKGIDYFENSRRATYVQREYAIRNPLQFELYSERCWGFTASDGPGRTTQLIDGVVRDFFDYEQRSAPFGPDDGTIAPWAAVASLPFAPDIVLPTIRYFEELDVEAVRHDRYGFKATFNATYQVNEEEDESGKARIRNKPIWVSPWHFGLNQGPIILMIENYRTEFLWKLMRRSPYLEDGLRKAGFQGGWL